MLLIVSGVFWHHPSHPRDTQYCIRVHKNDYGINLIASDKLALFCRNRGVVLKGVVGVPVVLVLDLICPYRDRDDWRWQRLDIRGLYPDLSSALDGYREIGGLATVDPGELDYRPEVPIPEDYHAL